MARLLLVEDEDYTMIGVVNALRECHAVTLRGTGADALCELREHWTEYDLVLLDLMLPRGHSSHAEDRIPRMRSEEVGEFVWATMEQICPRMPTIILTGVRSTLEGMRVSDNVELVAKPVLPADLLRRIQDMLPVAQRGTER